MEKNFNKENFDNGKCPHCGGNDISEITGWCYNHNCPQTFENDLVFCSEHEGGEMIIGVQDAWFCWECNSLFDDKKTVDFDSYSLHGCPVGEEQSPHEGEQESAEEYTARLSAYITEYSEEKINDCLEKGYFLEAIGTLQIQISLQLRFLLIKKIKGENNIPLDYENERFKKVLEWLKQIKDYELFRIAYIYERIDERQICLLTEFNKIRNRFVHSFQQRKINTENKIKSSINHIKEIESFLSQKIRDIGGKDINIDGS